MPRPPRADEAGAIYHALNRGNARHDIFFKEADYQAFECLIAEGLERFAVDLFAYQWMKNHWHMVLSPRVDGGMSAFVGWLTLTHTQRYHAHHRTTGFGHVYQGRYKSFPIQDDAHFHAVCRYVERNALTAKVVPRAEQYQWGSLWNWLGGESPIKLSTWPIRRAPSWVARVNQPISKKEKATIQRSITRGVPFGTDEWIDETVQRLGLESTTKPRGRPPNVLARKSEMFTKKSLAR